MHAPPMSPAPDATLTPPPEAATRHSLAAVTARALCLRLRVAFNSFGAEKRNFLRFVRVANKGAFLASVQQAQPSPPAPAVGQSHCALLSGPLRACSSLAHGLQTLYQRRPCCAPYGQRSPTAA